MGADFFFATSAKGLEEVLADELRSLDISGVSIEKGGVKFTGALEDCYRANLWLRTANRVLLTLAEFPCSTPQELYDGVSRVPWPEYLTPDMTMAVDCNLRDSVMTHSMFVALKTKDAIVDSVREKFGRRPDINPKSPDVQVNVHLNRNRCTISLDTSGGSLHQRGYRLDIREAPLRETLAAALVELTGWDGTTPFLDPMCGSGTIVIEAALRATRTAPGLLRREFAFQRWPDFDQALWKRLVAEAEGVRLRKLPVTLHGSDVSAKALEAARTNAKRAGVDGCVSFSSGDLRRISPPEGGVLLFNPPYGERIGDLQELKGLYREIGDTLKQRCAGSTAWIFTGNPELAKNVGLKASRRIVLFNGPIECRLLKYDLYQGR